MTVYLLLLSLLKNICSQVRQLQLGFDAESPRSDFTHERSSQGIDRVGFWGQNYSARHPRNSLEPRSNSLELARCPQNSRVVNELLRVICVYTFLVWVLPRNHHCTCMCQTLHDTALYKFKCFKLAKMSTRKATTKSKPRQKFWKKYSDEWPCLTFSKQSDYFGFYKLYNVDFLCASHW